MTTVAVTSTAHNPLAPSWDEAIVPTLRKRLESESRMLTQRLSTISGGSADDAKQQQPQLQEEEPHHDTRPPTSSSRRTPNGTRSHTPTNTNHLQRPSAIPRPSFSRAGERPNTPATRSNTAAPAEPSSSHENQSTTAATPARKRTQSTPFPFDPPPDLPTSSVPNGKQSASSSTNSGSGTAKSNGGRTTPTPSRIPTVPSRIRSGSQSSQGLNTLGKSVGAKVAPSESNSIHISESPSALTPVPPSSSASTGASRHRASEDHQGYRANKQPHAGIEESVNERPSSDEEEKPFQHWYRGDVSRNGGVGEYRVGKREEMLDIASFGHKPSNKTRRPEDSHGLPSIFNDRSLRKRAESISSVERTSLYMEDPDETIIGRILDESPLEDAKSINGRPRRQSIASMERISLYMAPVEGSDGVPSSETKSNTMNSSLPNQTPLPEPKNNNLPVLGSSAVPGKYPQSRTRNVSNPRHESKASTSTTSSLPETLASRKPTRGRAQSPVERSKTSQKRVDQKRSKSAADAVPHPKPPDEGDFSGLTPDAIPDTRTPIPIDGNWDEMVLPTVARRMGIEYEKKDSTTKSQEPLVAPAPGTFGFDYTKYRPWRPSEEAIPMSEFGMRSPSPPPLPPTDPEEGHLRRQEQSTQQEPSFSQPAYEVPIEQLPEAIQQMRPRRDTLPPFAHYAGTQHPKERHDMPQVVIHQQDMETTPRATEYVEEDEETRCCKCIIM